MNAQKRVEALIKLGTLVRNLPEEEIKRMSVNAEAKNGWFTEDNVRFAFSEWGEALEKEAVEKWVSEYSLENNAPKKVGIVAAGNVPMVGLHDVLSTLVSGNIALLKLSSDDNYLMKEMLHLLYEAEPESKERVLVVEMLKEADAFIATGSNNSSRYFEHYFSAKPHLIRKNRSSVAVLKGDEPKETLEQLGEDIFRYYGLGCRNVSRILVPEGYKPDPVFEALEPWKKLADHNKFANNYLYNRSIYLLGKEKFYENGFFIIKESDGQVVAPVSVIYMDFYKDETDLSGILEEMRERTQCIASRNQWVPDSLEIGSLQRPALSDYADGVDTMAFLTTL